MDKRLSDMEDRIKILFGKYDDLANNLRAISETNSKVMQRVQDMSIILDKLDRYLSPDIANQKPGVVLQTQYNLEDIKKESIRVDGAFHRIDELKSKVSSWDVKFIAWETVANGLSAKVDILSERLDKFKPINTIAVIGIVTIAVAVLGVLMTIIK